MLNSKLKISTGILLLTTLSACSSRINVEDIDNTLIIPPSLKLPGSKTTTKPGVVSSAQSKAPKQAAARKVAKQASRKVAQKVEQPRAVKPRKAAYQPKEEFYIIVGTYPDQLDALDTFTRISSIGLKGATMESRLTRAGARLHMVRLGPYSQQEDIDKAKDSLTSSGLSQFKVVKN